MKTFYVIKHDASWLPRIYGCSVSENPEEFRNIPLEFIEWNMKVRAETKELAAIKAKEQRKQK